jgi:hypothetical protein
MGEQMATYLLREQVVATLLKGQSVRMRVQVRRLGASALVTAWRPCLVAAVRHTDHVGLPAHHWHWAASTCQLVQHQKPTWLSALQQLCLHQGQRPVFKHRAQPGHTHAVSWRPPGRPCSAAWPSSSHATTQCCSHLLLVAELHARATHMLHPVVAQDFFVFKRITIEPSDRKAPDAHVLFPNLEGGDAVLHVIDEVGT